MKTDKNQIPQEDAPVKQGPKKNSSKVDAGRNRKGDNSQKAAGKSEGRK
jgi:hypothetical protein